MACAYHFNLPSPDGPRCIGVCRYCGEEREHLNGADIETSAWLRRKTKTVRPALKANGQGRAGDKSVAARRAMTRDTN